MATSLRISRLLARGRELRRQYHDSRGMPSTSSSTESTVNLIASLVNPLGAGVGPLSVAPGDFDGSGTSQLAVAPSESIAGQRPVVAIYQFELASGTLPMDAPVTPVLMTKSFTPTGMGSSAGFQLAAADLDGKGQDELIVGSAGGGAKKLDILSYQTATAKWTLKRQLSLDKLDLDSGVFVEPGDLAGTGKGAIVVGSATHNEVDVLNPSTGGVEQSLHPFAQGSVEARVSVVAAINQPGAIVVTPVATGASTAKAVIISASTWTGKSFTPVDSPGAGGLVPLGAGYVYQRSTIQNLTTSLPTSDGPATPSVIFRAEWNHAGCPGLRPDQAELRTQRSRHDRRANTFPGDARYSIQPARGTR